MKKNVFQSCPKYLGALTWNHPETKIAVIFTGPLKPKVARKNAELETMCKKRS